jgi:hypothetical protein
MPQPKVADVLGNQGSEADQPERAGRGGMASNLLLLVLWVEW